MYTVYADDICIYDDTQTANLGVKLIEPTLSLAENSAGSFTATVPITNVYYDSFKIFATNITVRRNDDVIWFGRVLSEEMDFWKNKKITCEGALAFLNDTTQLQATYKNISVPDILGIILGVHNEKVGRIDPRRQIFVGNITVANPDQEETEYTLNYDTTIDVINNQILGKLGGYMMVRQDNGALYLDYLSDYPHTSTQQIVFGKNLLDYTKKFDSENYATVLVPLGAMADDGEYVTVAKVNGGSIYVESSAVDTYGWVEKVEHFEMVAAPWRLMEKAEEYLHNLQFNGVEIEIKAVDLSLLNVNAEAFNILDKVRVISQPHGMDKEFPITKIDLPLANPQQAKYKLGGKFNSESLTDMHVAQVKQFNQVAGTMLTEDSMLNAIARNTFSKKSSNMDIVVIRDSEKARLFNFTIFADVDLTVMFGAEIKCTIDTDETIDDEENAYVENDCLITAYYYIDGISMPFRPSFTKNDGEYTIHLLRNFSVNRSNSITFSVDLSSEHGTVNIKMGDANGFCIGIIRPDDTPDPIQDAITSSKMAHFGLYSLYSRYGNITDSIE